MAGWVAKNEAGLDGVIEDGFHGAEFMGEGLGGELGATLREPAFAVGFGDVAQGNIAEVAFEGATPPLDAPGLEGVAGDSQPAVGGLAEISAGVVGEGEVADLAAQFLEAVFGELAVPGFERAAKLLAASLDQRIISARWFLRFVSWQHQPVKASAVADFGELEGRGWRAFRMNVVHV